MAIWEALFLGQVVEDFVAIDSVGVWWTSTKVPDVGFYYVGLSYNYQDTGMERWTTPLPGASIRCVRDSVSTY